jgi:hypothetical protein
VISACIDANPSICRNILRDLKRGGVASQLPGAEGIRAVELLRCLVVKTFLGFTYMELACHIIGPRSCAGSAASAWSIKRRT